MAQTVKHTPAVNTTIVSQFMFPQLNQAHCTAFRGNAFTVCTARRVFLQEDLLLEEELAWLLLPSLPASTKGVPPTFKTALPGNAMEGGGRWHACRCTERRGLQPAFMVQDQPYARALISRLVK